MILRPYQSAASNAIFQEWQTVNATLAVMATGLGKTVLAADLARRMFPRRTLFLAHRDWLAATTPRHLAEFALELGLSVAAFKAAGAAWAAPHAAWAFPMCDGYGNTLGIRLRANDGRKFAVRGSKQGIFIAKVPPQPTLFVCEGPTDTAAAVELGLFAVGRPNCCCGGADIKIFARRHQCHRVVVVSDNDKPGLDGARKVGAEIGLPFAVYVPPAKDLREFVRLGGTRTMIENTLNNTVWHQHSKPITNP